MSNEMKLPLKVVGYEIHDANGAFVCSTSGWCNPSINRERAAHIVKCVNSHDGLVEALNTAVEVTLDYIKINNLSDADANHWLKEAQAALAKAQGEHK